MAQIKAVAGGHVLLINFSWLLAGLSASVAGQMKMLGLWAIFSVMLSNIVLMLPVCLLYFLADGFLKGNLERASLPFYVTGICIAAVLIILTTIFQYHSTFLTTYVESGIRRRTLAEKLRKLPLSFFSKKDLSDLTNTIMNDCAVLETASSHWIPELTGALFSTSIVSLSLLIFNWKMALACLWVLPVSFGIVLSAKKVAYKICEKGMKLKLDCADSIQEGLETVRDLKSYNAAGMFLEGFGKKVKAVEKQSLVAEFLTSLYVVSAQMILKVGIGTVALTGSILLAKGEINLLTFFMFLMIVSRLYDPLQVALQNFAAVLSCNVRCARMD